MLRDVNIIITDGQMGAGATVGEGVHLKIGASPIVSEELIAIRGTYDAKRIKQLLGLSPLADACMDSVANGAGLIYCMPVKPSTAGSVDIVKHTGAGTGTVAIVGTPNNTYDVVINVTETGGLNEAAITYSLNAGVTVSDEITIPLNGSYILPDTGISLTFTEGVQKATSFIDGDTYTFTATAPQLTNADILTAIGKIKNLKETFEFVHIVGETVAATWAAVSTAQNTLVTTDKIPMMFILEAYKPNAEEGTQAYIDGLIKARKTVYNYDLQVVTARANYVRMDGTTRNINLAGVICGLYARAKVQQSIGRTSEFPLSEDKVLKLMPEGIDEHIQYLDEAGYLTLRKYVGLDGYYVTNARMMCPEGSDYKYAEHTRVKNKLMRKIRKEALMQLHTEIDLADVDGSLQVLTKFLETPIEDLVKAKEISSGRIMLADGQNADSIIESEKVSVKAKFTPKGYAREFEIDLGMEKLV